MLSDKVLRLISDKKRLSSAYLALTMKTEAIRKQVGQVISGSSGQRNISQAEIRNLILAMPPLEEQQRISSRLHSAQSQTHRERNAVVHLRQVKTGLMQDLLTGKVRVKVDDFEEVAP
jgi:type I restriction enzyme S subunit